MTSRGATLRQHFGNGAYALSGVYGAGAGQPNAKCAFIVYLDPNYFGPFPKRRPKQQAQQQPETTTTEKTTTTANCCKRGW